MSLQYKQFVEETILDEKNFIKAMFTGGSKHLTKLVIRPVLIKGRQQIQFSYFDAKKDITKNYSQKKVSRKLTEMFKQQFTSITIQTTTKNFQITIPKKGKPVIHEHQAKEEKTVVLSHDKEKQFILSAGKPIPFLQTLGIMNQDGSIKADKQNKFKQINEFLKIIDHTVKNELQPFSTIVDFGCGSGYLTLAVYYYFNEILKIQTQVIGVDNNAALIKKLSEQTNTLGWEQISFEASTIKDFTPLSNADIVVALHACDTATDDALAQGIEMDSSVILVSPCCHHHIQTQVNKKTNSPLFDPMLQHAILRERFFDILTDTFRSLILQIMGYKTDIIEFIASEHTAKNLMIRAIKNQHSSIAMTVHEYTSLKKYWKVTPYLETLLEKKFKVL